MEYPPGLTSCAHIKNAISTQDIDNIVNYAINNVSPLPFKESLEESSENLQDLRKTYSLLLNNSEINLKVETFIKKIDKHIQNANKLYNFDIEGFIDFNYFEYPQHSSHLEWHMDLANVPIGNNRKLAFSIFANSKEEYEGGNLEIFSNNRKIPKTIKGSKGDLVIFPSYLMHRITPITKGTRKVFVGWVGGEPFK